MDDGRPKRAVTAGRVGLLLLAAGTAWGAVAASDGGAGIDGAGIGGVLVAAPVIVATNPHPTAVPTAAFRPDAADRVSRDQVRTAPRLPRQARTSARRHAPR